jgi:demethylmenaquinone methyltransferase/2-methoxy-6-polyprenyl-1,4-benzoquinol methylase
MMKKCFGPGNTLHSWLTSILIMSMPDQIHQPQSGNAAEFAPQIDDVFGRIASRYDRLCDLFSFGIHRTWKRRVADIIAQEEWQTLLDGATGTGDIMLRVLAKQLPASRRIIASDISPQMLAIAQGKLGQHGEQVRVCQLDMHSMPDIASESVDAYSISLGLKICQRHLALQEALRVLRPGGRLIILEASNIRPAWLHKAYLTYMSICTPAIAWMATGGDASAYKYLLQGVREFPGAEQLAKEMQDMGFSDVQFERLSLGIVALHTARKPG